MNNKFTYQEAFLELQNIVEEIEAGETGIDELSEKIKRASVLIEICQAKLNSTEKEVELLLNNINNENDDVTDTTA